MNAITLAQQHLAKAHEFLEAAEVDIEFGHLNAATSNAVTSGINSKDAICLALTGRTNKSEDHRTAVKELESAGSAGAALAPTLGRLLALKAPAQYQASGVARSKAESSVRWARKMHEAAVRLVP